MSTGTENFYTSADGLRLFYREYAGSAPTPVVCLPGLTRNSRDFSELAATLSPRHRVLTPDLRGRGRSAYDPVWRNYHPGTYVQDVLALFAHAKIERAYVIGTSLGGLIGMILGAMQPQRVAGLVLNDVGPEVDRDGVARIAQYVGRSPPVKSWEEAARQAQATYGAAMPDYTLEDWLRYARRSYKESESGAPVLDMDPKIGDAVRAGAGTGPAPDLWPMWAMLRTMPMLVIRGANSDILSAPTLERMQREASRTQSIIVPNRGHAPTLDEPVCVAAIEKFLTSTPA